MQHSPLWMPPAGDDAGRRGVGYSAGKSRYGRTCDVARCGGPDSQPVSPSSRGSAQQYQGSLTWGIGLRDAAAGLGTEAPRPAVAKASSRTRAKVAARSSPAPGARTIAVISRWRSSTFGSGWLQGYTSAWGLKSPTSARTSSRSSSREPAGINSQSRIARVLRIPRDPARRPCRAGRRNRWSSSTG